MGRRSRPRCLTGTPLFRGNALLIGQGTLYLCSVPFSVTIGGHLGSIYEFWGQMKHELFLIAPGQGTAEDFRTALNSALEIASISALLLKQGERSDDAYGQFVMATAPLAQKKGAAVLLDNRPDLVRGLGADGVHMTGGIKAVREALDALKPDFIVGTGDIGSRHEAMLRGELEIDYLMFGDRQVPEWTGADMANWWAETFEVASVYLAENVDDPALANLQSEFLGLPDAIWSDPAALARLTEAGK